MKFVTFEKNGKPAPGLLEGDKVFALTGFSSLLEIIQGGAEAQKKAAASRGESTPLASTRLLTPIAAPPKLIFIGLNYRDHAIECGAAIPTIPVVFSKFNNSIIGPGDAIKLPPSSKEPDYEAELAVVIGKRGKYITQQNWQEYVFGYTALHDVSARDVQLATSQWLLGKSFDTFAPIGPAIVTADEIADPNKLKIECIINGEVLQSSTTAEMIFHVPYLIEHVSKYLTLEPGDIISTGTPAGVGMAKSPKRWLRPGDETIIRIEGIPDLVNTVETE